MSESERTLSIVKPDAVEKGKSGEILARFEQAGLRIVALKKIRLTPQQAEGFYAVHRQRPFFKDLVAFMTSGPVVVSVLEGEGAIARNRELMGPTDSKKAPKGTIRGDFGTEVTFNLVHGSDSDESAEREIGIWLPELA